MQQKSDETKVTNTETRVSNEQSNNDDEEKFVNKNKHPVFDRKTKVVGNDSFLKQIFS